MARKKKTDDESDDGNTTTGENTEMEETVEVPTEKPKKEKSKGLSGFDAFAAAAKKKWGDNVAIASTLSSTGIPRISFGNIGLDIATFGGCPRGRMVRLWGHPKSAKTGSALTLVAEWQKHCSNCFERGPCSCDNREKAGALWVDAEGRSLDNLGWMEAHGIDMSRLIVQRPPTGEQVVDLIDAALRDENSGIGLIVLDSIAHVVSSKELDKATEDGEVMAVNAKLMNSALRKWTAAFTSKGLTSKKQPTLILLNQIRSKVSLYGGDTMPGGRGLDFSTSLDIKFQRGDPHYLVNTGTEEAPVWIDKKAGGAPGSYKPTEDQQPDYVEIDYKITESSVCPKGRYGTFDYWLRATHGHRYGDPSNSDRIFEYAKSYNFLGKAGKEYTLRTLKAPTYDELKVLLRSEPDLQKELWVEIIDKLKK